MSIKTNMEFEEYETIINSCKSLINDGLKFPDVTPPEYFEEPDNLPFIQMRSFLEENDLLGEVNRYEKQKKEALREKINLQHHCDIKAIYWNKLREVFNESLVEAHEMKRGYLKTLNNFFYRSYFEEGLIWIDNFFGRKEAKQIYNKDKTSFIKTINSILIAEYKDLKNIHNLSKQYDPPVAVTEYLKGTLNQIFKSEFIIQIFHEFEFYSYYYISRNQIPPVEIASYSNHRYKAYDYDSIMNDGTIIPNYMLKGDEYWETAYILHNTRPRYSTWKGVYQELKKSREMLGLDAKYISYASFKRGKSHYNEKNKGQK